ncbi:MAG: hypothetical protein ABI543_07375 [Ignavibacteria bacterium]
MPEINYELISPLFLEIYRRPSITAYNRLEATPRTEDFTRSLKAEVRDPLWMLTRQWQFGEFQGEDAGSPVTAQIYGVHDKIDRIGFPGNRSFQYDENIPLEVKVERETIKPDLYLSVQSGRYFMRLLRKNTLEVYTAGLITKYPLEYDIHANDSEALQLLAAVEKKIFDGIKLIIDINNGSFDTWADTTANPSALKNIAQVFNSWYKRLYSQSDNENDSAWIHQQLEYNFDASTASTGQKQKTFTADKYYEGHLDWYSFDYAAGKKVTLQPEPALITESENLVSFIPNTIQFKGMPNPRFWEMEENRTDFGKIDTSTTGLLHLLFAEFGLIYSNDWFMLPYPLQINTICEMKNIMITDVFGQHIIIKPAGKGSESDWHKWIMFHHSDRNATEEISNSFYLVPALTKSLESEPIEKVNFLRDEMANMVWAVENIVPSHIGKGVRGNELALKEVEKENITPVGNSEIKYVLGTTVPDNWIPFIPVHLNGNISEISLQRAQMPASPGARGVVLTEKSAPFFINEEEVPRAGVLVQRSYQRARWLNGKTFLWIGRYKEAGKGEGWSNLKFDQIEDIRPSN